MISSFSPHVTGAPRVLVLGSMPGVRSLNDQQYYAHPQNQFWRLMAAVFDEAPPAEYPDRLAMLDRHKVALWDVLGQCEREGSLDSAIRAEQANDIAALLDQHPSIVAVALNGKKAASSFRKHIQLAADITVVELPSSSAANARASFDDKCRAWLAMRAFIKPVAVVANLKTSHQ